MGMYKIMLASTMVKNQTYHLVYLDTDDKRLFALTNAGFWPVTRWYTDPVELVAELGFKAFDEGSYYWWDLYHFAKSVVDNPAMKFFRVLVAGR